MALLNRDDAGWNDVKALLAAGTEFEGKLNFGGALRIDGKFSGSITDGDMLIVGEGARVSAEISCGTVVICGEVTGNIRARRSVELRQQGAVRGDIETPSLIVERGALFEGHMKVEAVPAAIAARDLPPGTTGTTVPAPLVVVNS